MDTLGLEARKRLTLAATVLGSSLAFIDATVVIVALPTIEEDLGLGLTGQQWVFLSYSLSLAALYLVGGAIGDRYGRRRVFIAGAAGFALASLLAGAAPNEAVLILARALQGVAGAFLTTNSLALLRGAYGADSGRAIGLWTSFTSIATILGPPAGGALVEWVSWRWIFLLNLPLAAVAVVLALLGREEGERASERTGRLDLAGAALAASGFGLLTYGLVEGAERGFGDLWWTFVVAALALGAFVVVELRIDEPMLPFALFRERNFAAANAQTFLVYAGLYGFIVFFTLYLQFLGFTPFEAGLLNIPSSLILIVLAARFGALADRHGPRLYLTVGPALIGLGTLVFALVDTKSEFWTLRRRRAPALLPRPGDDGGSDHRHGAQVGARALRRHRLGRQLHGLAARQPDRHRRDRARDHAGLRGEHRRRGGGAAGDRPACARAAGSISRSLSRRHGRRRRARVRGRGHRGLLDLEPGGARRGAALRQRTGAGASRKVSASARARARTIASSRVSPNPVKIASR